MKQSNKPVSALRQRMIDDMTLRKLSPKTQIAYIRAVKNFTRFFGQSPDTATAEDLRRYQLHLVQQGTSSGMLNATLTGLRFFFEVTLDRPGMMKHTSHVHQPRKLPVILSVEEVTRLLKAAGSLKYQAALGVAYGAGLPCRRGFFLPVRVLSRLFRRRFLERLQAAHRSGQLQCLGHLKELVDTTAFAQWLQPVRRVEWVVYAKHPFAGPEAVLAYLSRYTHRVAIANSRLIACDERGVSFRWKDYRIQGHERYKTMTLATDEFIRRFLLHVLPGGFHRIRHYGLFANPVRAENVSRARDLLCAQIAQRVPTDAATGASADTPNTPYVCPSCGAPMIVVETFERGQHPRAPPGSGTL